MTESVARKIQDRIGSGKCTLNDVRETSPLELEAYKFMILGIPTWGIGEVQEDWADFMSGLGGMDLSGRKAALFGLGDQESYPDSFADALGTLYDALHKTGCEILGNWPATGYQFEESAALRGKRFAGLVLDEENQPELTDLRIDEWLGRIPGLIS